MHRKSKNHFTCTVHQKLSSRLIIHYDFRHPDICRNRARNSQTILELSDINHLYTYKIKISLRVVHRLHIKIYIKKHSSKFKSLCFLLFHNSNLSLLFFVIHLLCDAQMKRKKLIKYILHITFSLYYKKNINKNPVNYMSSCKISVKNLYKKSSKLL